MTPEQPHKWRIFIVVAAGVFMSTMDSSMVNIALPTIMQEFQSPLKETEWVVLIYLLTITSSILIWGTLSDRLGRHIIYPLGLLTFAAGSFACAYAPTLSCLVAARFGQALGAGMMMSTGPAIIKETFPAGQLGRGLGMISISVSLGLMTGPMLGGLLLEFFSWRALFWITVPIGLIFAVAGRAFIPRSQPAPSDSGFNWFGAAAWISFLTFFSLAVSHASSPAWSTVTILFYSAGAIPAFILFCRVERRSHSPFLPAQLINKRFYYSALICAMLSFMVLFSALIIIPFFLDLVQNLPKAKIGLIMMTIPVIVLLIAPAAGWISDKIPAKILSTIGLCLSSFGAFLLSDLAAQASQTEVIVKLAILGSGQALFLAPNSASVLNKVSKNDTGRSAALLATARNLGMLVGIALSSLVFSHRFSRLTGGLDLKDYLPQHSTSFMSALQAVFLTAAIIGIVGSIVSWRRDQ